MIVNNLKIENFRNIQSIDLSPCENLNIICGDNAQGKTNLIEAIWLFTGAKSFRGAKNSDFVRFNQDNFKLKLEFFSQNRNQTAKIGLIDKKKLVHLNDVKKKSATDLTSTFCATVFSPLHLNLVKGTPQIRRNFIDAIICQVRPNYICVLKNYKKILNQRNNLLVDLSFKSSFFDLLDVYDLQLSNMYANIAFLRQKFISQLDLRAKSFYLGISNNKEAIDIAYTAAINDVASLDKKQIADSFLQLLKKYRKLDLKYKSTTIGAHREDFSININNIDAKNFASQGQQRSIVICLKLAENTIINDCVKEKSIVLLDDVMSELDKNRKNFLLNNLIDKQVFITCCDKDDFNQAQFGQIFYIDNGKIV